MGKGAVLGEFEQVVLLATARLGDEAFGGDVHDEIVSRTGRTPSVPSVYVTLARLEKKGLVTSTVEDGNEGGRARKRFALTEAGVVALEASRRQFDRLWAGLDLGAAEGRS